MLTMLLSKTSSSTFANTREAMAIRDIAGSSNSRSAAVVGPAESNSSSALQIYTGKIITRITNDTARLTMHLPASSSSRDIP